MSKIERANKILIYLGGNYTSALWDKDVTYEEHESRFLWVRNRYKTRIITERLADQIIDVYKLKDFKEMLVQYVDYYSTKKGGALIFEYDKNIDEDGYEAAKIMLGAANSAYNVYKEKLDTPAVDKATKKLVKMFSQTLLTEDNHVYGSYVGSNIKAIGRVSDTNKQMLKNFQENMDAVLLNEEKAETVDLELK